MKKFRKTILIIGSVLLMCANNVWASHPGSNETNKVRVIPIQLQYTPTQTFTKFSNLGCGIKVVVTDHSTNDQINRKGKVLQTYSFTPSKENFVRESIKRCMRTMGFRVDNNTDADFRLSVSIESFNTTDPSVPNTGIILNFTVYDPDNNIVFTSTAFEKLFYSTSNAFNRNYAKAIESIDWGGIAALLRKPKQTAQVQGTGNTELELLIINWEVTSRPAGADLYWRVISSTPDVKNTNKNYKSTTPYESTESFDIRGLTYQNSGDVQIELTCEKPGYLPQRKVFNVRMCIDQKSINAHFTLVKDE